MHFKYLPMHMPWHLWSCGALAILFAFTMPASMRAQNETVLFSTSATGVSTVITNWGVNTLSTTDIQRDLLFMGSNSMNFVLVGFQADMPQTNNSLTSSDLTVLTNNIIAASMVPTTSWVMSFGSGAGVNSWYQSGSGTVYPDRWATNMEVWQRYYNHSMLWTMPFNEPDYSGWGEGSPQNLHDIIGHLLASTNYSNSAMAGGTALDDDNALSWFNTISPLATVGTTHCLAGSVASYVSFIQSVTASNAVPVNPEVHNLGEVIIGAQYGLKGVSWWGPALRARGGFALACQGQELGYADDWNNWTAAAVYRGTNGSVQAFLGGSERMAVTTSYRFFSTDRDVFYEGYGPQRDYTVTVPGGSGYAVNQPDAEKVLNISWGSDVQPPINGRYIIVNHNSHLVLEVPGGSNANGVQLDQKTYTGALYQQWDVNPLPGTFGGDCSYFTIRAAHDGVTADLNDYSFADGDQIQQWNGGTNEVEQWYFQYTTNGYFKIRSRWSNKVMGVSGASTGAGAQIVQWDDTGSLDQQWRLVPVGNPVTFVTPPAPTGPTAMANAASIQLNWNAGSGTIPVSYTVLRGVSSGGPYYIIARGLTNDVFTDHSANQPQTYFYVIAAMDGSLNQSPYSAEVNSAPTLAPTLLANYDFERNTLDSSINANTAEAVGSPFYTVGRLGAAVSLDGTDQYIMAPAGIMASATNFTIAAWVNWNGGAAWQRIFDFGNGTAQYMFLTPSSGSGTLRFAITTNGAGAEQQLNASPLPTAQWVHVAVTYNGSTASLYTNGVLAASGAVNVSPAGFNPVLNNFGASQYPGDPFFGGLVDSVYIYNYALNGTQIQNLVNELAPGAPAAPTGLSVVPGKGAVNLTWTQSTSQGIVLNNIYRSSSGSGGPYYPIGSEAAATSYLDATVGEGITYYYAVTAVNSKGESPLSGKVGSVTATPGPLPTLMHRYHFAYGNANDIVGKANGVLVGSATVTGGQLVIPNPTPTAPATNYLQLPSGILTNSAGGMDTAVTVEAWTTIYPGQYAWANLFDFGDQDSGGDAAYDIHVCIHSSDNATIAGISDSDNANADYQYLDLGSGSSLDGKTNMHVTAVFNPPGGYAALYLNGSLSGLDQSVTIPMSGVQAVRNIVGADNWPDPGMQGTISELRIYNGALQGDEIAATQVLGPNQLLSTAAPVLQLTAAATDLTFSWPLASASFALQQTTNLATGSWTNVTAAAQIVGGQWQLTLPVSGPAAYFRLAQ